MWDDIYFVWVAVDHYNTSNWKTEDSAGLPNLHQFLMQLNRFPQLGDTLYHRNLARVLEAVAVNGTNVFYEGDFAKNFVKEVNFYLMIILDRNIHKKITVISLIKIALRQYVSKLPIKKCSGKHLRIST